ncbi:MAG: SAM-dependent methyltransferase [Lachnospiraceae bacterium]|nr:SAM-dependent methyltransferase [Lachnospiraceae bacterium]
MNIHECLVENLNENLASLVVSGPKGNAVVSKIKVRPVRIKSEIKFQATEYIGTKVIHNNYDLEEAISYLEDRIVNNFKQCQIINSGKTTTILVSKKGKVNISSKKTPEKLKFEKEINLEHNKAKKYLLPEGEAVPFLVDLGVMTTDGKVIKAKYDKFRQINRFLEFIQDILPALPGDREITILDFGCGKSYLTFAVYYYLRVLNDYDVKIIGLDLKEDVIDKCNRYAQKYDYDKLTFLKGDIADYEGVSQVDMVITLHACDTATDYALFKAIKWNASVILSVPCCQHELNAQISNNILKPVLKYGILKERISALLTDGIRAELLEENGYRTDILEFIDMEHTPKNLLIRGVKTCKKHLTEENNVHALLNEINVNQTLDKLLKEEL